MLTVDDCNTIYKKYEYNNFFHKISESSTHPIDFCNTRMMIDNDNCTIFYGLVVTNIFWTGGYYLKDKSTGEYYEIDLSDDNEQYALNVTLGLLDDYDLYLHMAVDDNIDLNVVNLTWHPTSSLTMSVYDSDDESDLVWRKIYLDFHGHTVPSEVNAGTCDMDDDPTNLDPVTVSSDSEGYYIYVAAGHTGKSLYAINYDDTTFYGKVNQLKKLPILSADTLYKGTSQKLNIRVDEDTSLYKYQAYYNGRKLKDNIITLPYDVDDYISITVDILDPNYPNSTVKLKANTEVYIINTLADLEYAIANNIKTFKINITDISNLTLDGSTILNSTIEAGDSIFNNVIFKDCVFTDKGANTFNNTQFINTTITGDATVTSRYNNCTITDSTITDNEFIITGTITDNTFTRSLIISDGTVTITGNEFNEKGNKDYFPSFLYLTGEYTVTGNTFDLSDEWNDLEFSICTIKTTELNTTEFINTNTLNMNITYESEEPETFYYNLVDDDKIRAVRLN